MTYTVVQLDTKILWLFFDLSKVSDGRIVNRQKKKKSKEHIKIDLFDPYYRVFLFCTFVYQLFN